jgi:GTP-binding protein Era
MIMNKFRSGFVTIIGRPNVGKSTLMNYLVGEKLSIISNKPQTTRNKIQAILTKQDYQIVFLDTPGIHKPRHKLGEYMVNIAEGTLNEVDAVLFLTTPDEAVGAGDGYIIEQLKKYAVKTPVILVINKVDTVKKESIAKTIESFIKEYNFQEVIPISALNGDNVNQLIEIIVDKLPEGPQYFPQDMVTDQPEKFVVSEIIREKNLRNLEHEVPHGTAVEILAMKEDNGIVNIDATIYCEKDSHKSILIGKGGEMLKRIGQSARIDIEKLLGSKVFLQLWVKVKKDWRDNPSVLRTLGYK